MHLFQFFYFMEKGKNLYIFITVESVFGAQAQQVSGSGPKDPRQ